MVLDIFGNVFGRSKKGSASGNNVPPSPSPSQRTLPSADAPESSEFEASAGSNNVYPTILTNEMLQAPKSSSEEAAGLDYGEGSSKTWSSHKFRAFDEVRITNPMDNVPFVPTVSFASTNSSVSSGDLNNCWASLDKISLYLASSQSEYNFLLENNVVRETS